MRKLECPGCGANLELKDNSREFAFCEFCGAKIMFDDYRSSQHITKHIIDEAEIKRIEAEKENMKFQELQSRRSEILKQWDSEQFRAEAEIARTKKNLNTSLWLCLLGIGIYIFPFFLIKLNNLKKDYETKKKHRDYMRTLSVETFMQKIESEQETANNMEV